MPKFKMNACRIRTLTVMVILSLMVVLPVFSQPFDLAFLREETSVSVTADSPAPEQTPKAGLSLPEGLVDASLDFSRSLDENTVSLDEKAPDVLDDEDQTSAGGDEDPFNALPEDILLLQQGEQPLPISATLTPVYEEVNYILYIDANQLNLRAEPSTESEIIAVMKFGEKVTCVGQNENWMKVTYNDQTGYLKTEYTSQTMVFKDTRQTVYVKSSKLNLRSGPSTGDSIITSLAYMTRLTCIGIGDGWSKVKTSSGKIGYVYTEYLTTRAATSSSGTSSGTAPVNSSGNRIVDLAYSALGVPYVSCGSSLSGFDCSGLTSWVYRQVGITIPRSTSGYYTIGTGISYSEIQPGDILCMDTRRNDGWSSITHVGIYVGNGYMIHASSTNHKVVLQNVSQYLGWGVKLITVRRITG